MTPRRLAIDALAAASAVAFILWVALWQISLWHRESFSWQSPSTLYASEFVNGRAALGAIVGPPLRPRGWVHLSVANDARLESPAPVQGTNWRVPGFAFQRGKGDPQHFLTVLIFPGWLPAVAFAMLPAHVARRHRRERRRRERNLCPACGYDLTANASGVCPECGRPIKS